MHMTSYEARLVNSNFVTTTPVLDLAGVMQKVVEGDRPRQRRQTSDNGVRGFSETQKQALLDIHNYDRRLRKASDMRLMVSSLLLHRCLRFC